MIWLCCWCGVLMVASIFVAWRLWLCCSVLQDRIDIQVDRGDNFDQRIDLLVARVDALSAQVKLRSIDSQEKP